jgi:hypothetical protein
VGKTYKFDDKSVVTLRADTPDDGAGIFVDNAKKAHVDKGKSGSVKLSIAQGKAYSVRFELWNVTAGAFYCLFRISGKIKGQETEVYYYTPAGDTGLVPTPVAWQETFSIQSLPAPKPKVQSVAKAKAKAGSKSKAKKVPAKKAKSKKAKAKKAKAKR